MTDAGPVRQFLSIALPLTSPVLLLDLVIEVSSPLQVHTDG